MFNQNLGDKQKLNLFTVVSEILCLFGQNVHIHFYPNIHVWSGI